MDDATLYGETSGYTICTNILGYKAILIIYSHKTTLSKTWILVMYRQYIVSLNLCMVYGQWLTALEIQYITSCYKKRTLLYMQIMKLQYIKINLGTGNYSL